MAICVRGCMCVARTHQAAGYAASSREYGRSHLSEMMTCAVCGAFLSGLF